ncbi:MAG: protease HtpX [Helicobacteraceae bacterium]|nr:protease HtpX [Helicobacteraceae bacterium]
MLRILLFLATNVAIVVVASVTLSILGVNSYLTSEGLDFRALLIFCFVFGMTGSFISLMLSKHLAKWATKTRIVSADTSDIKEARLVETVRQLAQQANIGMPDVGIFPADQANAFATGWNKNRALVAISAGMLERYSDSEIRAVLAHEVSHVANGDMITLTLIQGVINTFVMFLARVIGYVVDRVVLKNEEGRGFGYVVTVVACEIVLSILASIIVMWFSRKREYAADEGAAYLAGAPSMIAALAHLQRESEMPNEMPKSLNAFGIAGGKQSGFARLFMSHPPLDKRIEALQNFVAVK